MARGSKPGGGARTPRLVPVVGFVAVLAVAGCTLPPPPPALDPLPADLDGVALTRDGRGSYGVVRTGTDLTVTGLLTGGANTRTALWRRDVEVSADELSCATWVAETAPYNQPGAALRLRPVPGGTTGVTVTKNVWFLGGWVFNVHVWDTRAPDPFTLVGQVVLDATFRQADGWTRPFPWRLCARAVGDRVDVLVWPAAQVEPAWGDPAYGGSVALPTGWNYPGVPGWYAGHLGVGDQITFTGLTAEPVTPVPPTSPPAPPMAIAIAP
jgi:hypothetical protein